MLPRLTRRRLIAIATSTAVAPSLTRSFAQTPVTTSSGTPIPSEAPRFAIVPLDAGENGYLELTLVPGETDEVRVAVVTEGMVPAELTLYRANTVPAAGGGFAAADFDDEPKDQTLWLDIEPIELATEPGTAVERTIPVSVPHDAEPGQYVAALVVQTGPLSIHESTMFNQIVRSATSVVINVPGEITPGMEIGEPEVTQQGTTRLIRIPVSNTGNILIKPEGTAVMLTPDGDEVLPIDVALRSVYAGLDNEFRVAIPDDVPAGDYLISCDIYAPAHDLHATIDDAPVTLPEANTVQAPETVTIEDVSVTPNGDPVQFLDVEIALANRGTPISTARISLIASHDGDEAETYDLSVNQAIPSGDSVVAQRYIPAGGWRSGEWTFALQIVAVDAAGAETSLIEAGIKDVITIP